MNEQSKRGQKSIESSSAEQLVSPGNAFSPDVSVFDNREALVFTMDLPGVTNGNVSVEVDEDRILSIKAKNSSTQPRGTVLMQEFETGDYFRAFSISEEFDSSRTSAKLENGVLEIILPRREDVKPRKIRISA